MQNTLQRQFVGCLRIAANNRIYAAVPGGRKYIVINQLTMKSIIINFFGIYKGVVSSDVLAYIAKHINQNSPFLWHVLDNDLYQEKLTERVLWYVDTITANENGTHTVNLILR